MLWLTLDTQGFLIVYVCDWEGTLVQSCSTVESDVVRFARQGPFAILDELVHICNLHRLVHYYSGIFLSVCLGNVKMNNWFIFARIWQI